MVKALAQLHSLFGRNSAVYSGLNLRKRRFAAPVHELCDVERFAGMCKDVFGNGTSGFAKDISEHIIQFEVALAFEQDYTQAFSSLSEGMQAAWVLYTKYDLSINDIAQHLNLP